MRKLLFSVALIAMTAMASVQAKELVFGTAVNDQAKINISTLLASPQQYLNQTVTVSGTIVGVCEKRGCWMQLASDAKFEKLRLKVKDGDMVFPMSAKGRTALATGKFTEVKLDLEHTRDYKSNLAERRGEKFDPASVTEGMSLYQVVPVGVRILE